jgi:hypothetical protein
MPLRGSASVEGAKGEVPFALEKYGMNAAADITVTGGKIDCKAGVVDQTIKLVDETGQLMMKHVVKAHHFRAKREMTIPPLTVDKAFVREVTATATCGRPNVIRMLVGLHRGAKAQESRATLKWEGKVVEKTFTSQPGADYTVSLEGPVVDCARGLTGAEYTLHTGVGARGTLEADAINYQ